MLNQTFDELKLEKHPDKTVIGRVEKGFDFLGYHISPEGLSLAKKTIENFISRAARLYEQEPGVPNDSSRLGLYVKRWVWWAHAGVDVLGYALFNETQVRRILRRSVVSLPALFIWVAPRLLLHPAYIAQTF